MGRLQVFVVQGESGPALSGLEFGPGVREQADDRQEPPPQVARLFERAAAYLNDWLSGKAAWDPEVLPLDVRAGTEFQRRVWRALREIPEGETRTYRDLSVQVLGHPRGARAIGQAMGANPLPLLWPCHRVLAANGLGGFGGGLPLKERLLQREAG